MAESWHMLPGDARGEVESTNIAAAIASLVAIGDPSQLAMRVERATQVNQDQTRVVYHLFPQCCVRGQIETTAAIITAYRSGELQRTDPTHPFLDCMAGLHNAHAILDWMKRGLHQRLEHNEQGTRTSYVAGSGLLVDFESIPKIRTRALAKAAALGRLGMALLRIEGQSPNSTFYVARDSVGMRNDEGAPISYDAAELLQRSFDDTLPHDHPFSLAEVARRNREAILRKIDRDVDLLILTPDAMRKRSGYNPNGPHAYIDKNAPGHIWDAAEKHFFG